MFLALLEQTWENDGPLYFQIVPTELDKHYHYGINSVNALMKSRRQELFVVSSSTDGRLLVKTAH